MKRLSSVTGCPDNGYVGIFLSKAIFGGLCPHKVAVLSATAIFSLPGPTTAYTNNMDEIDNFLVLPSSSNKTQCTIFTKAVEELGTI